MVFLCYSLNTNSCWYTTPHSVMWLIWSCSHFNYLPIRVHAIIPAHFWEILLAFSFPKCTHVLGMSNSDNILIVIVKYTYPIMILNVDISSFTNKVIHHFNTGSFSCHMQGSYLMKWKKLQVHARNKLNSRQVSVVMMNIKKAVDWESSHCLKYDKS